MQFRGLLGQKALRLPIQARLLVHLDAPKGYYYLMHLGRALNALAHFSECICKAVVAMGVRALCMIFARERKMNEARRHVKYITLGALQTFQASRGILCQLMRRL